MKTCLAGYSDTLSLHTLGSTVRAIQGRNGGLFWSEVQLERMRSSGDIIIVTKEHSRIVGFLIAMVHHPTKTARIEFDFFVEHSYRGKGVRQQLMWELEEQMRARGILSVLFLTKMVDAAEDEGFLKRKFPSKSSPLVLMELVRKLDIKKA